MSITTLAPDLKDQKSSFFRKSWFQLVQSLGIVAGLVTSALVMHSSAEAKRTETLFRITEGHRQIWTRMLDDPSLFRVVSANPDMKAQPITDRERLMVVLLVLHLSATYEASKRDQVVPIEQMRRDTKTLMNFPIFQAVWNDLRHFQNADFRQFIDASFREERPIYSIDRK